MGGDERMLKSTVQVDAIGVEEQPKLITMLVMIVIKIVMMILMIMTVRMVIN